MQTNIRKLLLTTTTLVVLGATPAIAQVQTSVVGDGTVDGDTVNTLYDNDGTGAIGPATQNTFTDTEIQHDDSTVLTIEDNVAMSTAGTNAITVSASGDVVVDAGTTVASTGTGDVINLSAGDSTITLNGSLNNAGGGSAIDLSSSGAGATTVNVNSTTATLVGDIVLGTEDDITFTGDGTNDYAGDITATTGAGNTITLNNGSGSVDFSGDINGAEIIALTGAGDSAFSGALSNIGDINVTGGTLTIDDSDDTFTLTNGITVNGASSVINIANQSVTADLTLTDGTAVLTGSTITGDIAVNTTTFDTITGDIQLGTAGHSVTYSGDNSALAAEDAAITGGVGSDTVNFSNSGTFAQSGAIASVEAINVNGGGTVNLSGDVTSATSVDISSSSTLNYTTGTLGATDVDIDGGSTFTYNSANAFAGTITEQDADEVQTLNIGSSAGTLSGDITLGGGADTVNIDGGTFSGAVNTGTGTDVITLNAATFTGGFDGGETAQTATVDGGTVSFDSAVTNLADIDVNTGATVAFGTGATFSGTVSDGTAGAHTVLLDGASDLSGATLAFSATAGEDTLDVDNTVTLGTVTGAADADFAAGATVTLSEDVAVNDITFNNATTAFVTTIDATNDVDTITAAGTVTNAGGGTISIDQTNSDLTQIKTGNSYTLISNAGGGNLSGSFALADDTIGQFIQFTEDTTTADVYAVTATSSVSSTYDAATDIEGTASNLTNVTNAILGVPADGATIDAVQTALLATTTTAAAEDVVEELMPSANGSSIAGSLAINTHTDANIHTRLNEVRTGMGNGVSSGSSYLEGASFWVQGFGQIAEQDNRDGLKGYEADTIGATFGVDTESMADNLLAGIAFTYANTDVDSNNANRTNTDIDSYQVTLYGEYDLERNYFVSGDLSYAHNEIDQTRKNVGVSNLTAKAGYDSAQFGAGLAVGRQVSVNSAHAGNVILTPKVSADYVHVSTDDYTETGAGSLSLQNVQTDDVQVLDLGVSVDATWLVETEAGLLKPSVHAGYSYDAINDDVQVTSTFNGGGSSFATQGIKPDESSFNVGAGVSFEASNNLELRAEYDFEIKDDFDAHSGLVRARYNF